MGEKYKRSKCFANLDCSTREVGVYDTEFYICFESYIGTLSLLANCLI